MSTQQILGVVGGVVGSFFGYPQLGFVVGSLVGGLLTPAEKVEGPRVDDLKVQVSTYGAGIPILYGTERIGGNVVWSTDKIEIETTTGGKGGGPESTTYRYYVHMGIVLCETPRDGSIVSIVQIFQDGKLIYDARSGIPVGSALASAENPHAYFVLYQGHADQLPDPGEEAWMGGPGSVPAYRGVVRIRMNAVECPGGRVPQFSFVLTTTSAASLTTEFAHIPNTSGVATAESIWAWEVSGSLEQRIRIHRAGPGGPSQQVALASLGTPHVYFDGPYAVAGRPRPSAMYAIGEQVDLDQTFVRIVLIDLQSGNLTTLSFVDSESPGGLTGIGTMPHAAYDASTDKFAVTRGYNESQKGMAVIPSMIECDVAGMSVSSPIAFYDGLIYAFNVSDGKLILVTVDASSGAHLDTFEGPVVSGTIDVGHSLVQADENGVFVHAWLSSGGSRVYRILLDGATSTWLAMAGDADPIGSDDHAPGDASQGLILPTGAILGPNIDGSWIFHRYQTFDPQPVSVAEIIGDICSRAGEDRTDLAEIPESDVLHGFKIQNPASARSNIDPLLTAFAAYMVDEDGFIKFKKYADIESAATISYDELGQAEAGSEVPDAMPLNRMQEIDLPRSVSASYIEPLNDYQTATEKEVRQITDATEDMILELPIATTSDHAKAVAQMILFNRWRSQNTRSFKTSRKFAFLSPGDGATVEYPRGTWRLWRITSMTDTGVLCEFNAEPGDAEIYKKTATGATGYIGQEVAPLPPPTRLQLLDIPILRDQDNNSGIYAAMAGFGPGWPGGELFVGDDIPSLQTRGTVQHEAPMGFAESALSTWASGSVDETSLLVVNVGHHTLHSIPRATFLTGSENVAAIGGPGRWEIVKFQRADDLGEGRYRLSGFMRGQRGTEWARGLHQQGDTFVLLALAGVLRPNLDSGSIGQAKTYAAVTKGRSLNSASTQTYANAAEGLETFSPTNLTKEIVGGSISFSWVRRTRLSENWLAGIVPLGEAQERYEVVLYTSGTFESVLRVISSSTRTATYTAEMQAEDGYAGGPLYVRVYQLSDIVGRGHPLETTI